MSVTRADVEAAFPELDRIEDDDLRAGVVDAWLLAAEENDRTDLAAIPWLPAYQPKLDLDDETLVGHVRDVTAGAIALAESLIDRRGADLDLDTVIAGGLVHDVSQLGEFDGWDTTEIGSLLGHPHYGVYVVLKAGLPVEIAHVVLSHTAFTSLQPATLEAEVVERADRGVASSIRWRVLDDLRDAPDY